MLAAVGGGLSLCHLPQGQVEGGSIQPPASQMGQQGKQKAGDLAPALRASPVSDTHSLSFSQHFPKPGEEVHTYHVPET